MFGDLTRMEQVSGIPGGVPPLADYPPSTVRSTLPPAEWQACLDSWLYSLEFRLRLKDVLFSTPMSPAVSGMRFLISYCQNTTTRDGASAPKEAQLQRRAYLLFKRLMSLQNTAHSWESRVLIDNLLLADRAFHHVSDWPRLLSALRKREQGKISQGLEEWKGAVTEGFGTVSGIQERFTDLQRMNSLIQVMPEAGLALMTGSDYLETIIAAYTNDKVVSQSPPNFIRILTEHLYRGLRSLMSDQTKHISLLLDHLYFLRTETDAAMKGNNNQKQTILSSLLCTTAFLRHLAHDSSIAETKRGQGQIDSLIAYRDQIKHLHPPPALRKRKSTKGKGKSKDADDMHIHKAAQVSQIHDLFPTFPNAYILQLLDHYNDNVELVIAALLEPDTLPSNLREPDPNLTDAISETLPPPNLAPHTTPPPLPSHRKNAFDNDAFDNLTISSTQLHKGRKPLPSSSDPPDQSSHARSKAAILAALAAFDSDDDERDDTYDVADVGGTVDQSVDTDSRPNPTSASARTLTGNDHEETLWSAWKGDTGLFARDSKTRVSRARMDLKRETGMADEQIEGWGIVVSRDRALQERLRKRYEDVASMIRGQRGLEKTKWQGDSSRGM